MAHLYTSSKDIATRRRTGLFYSTEPLAHYILDRVGFTAESGRHFPKLLDMSCGTGVFLVLAARLLSQRGIAEGMEPSDILDSIRESIYGIDVDPVALAQAKLNITKELHPLVEQMNGGVSALYNIPLNLVWGNALADDFYLPEFDYVVGNPPYVRVQQLDHREVERFREHFRVAYGAFDLYSLFFEAGLALLREGGKLGFVTPRKYAKTVHSERLRDLLLRFRVEHLGLVEKDAFQDNVAVKPVVTIVRKTLDQCATPTFERVRIRRSAPPPHFEIIEKHRLLSSKWSETFWLFLPNPEIDILDALRCAGKPLSEICSVNTCLATGNNNLFVMKEQDISHWEVEGELIKPVLRGKDVRNWLPKWGGLYILYPYAQDSNGHLKLIDLEFYPRAREYLWKNRRRPAGSRVSKDTAEGVTGWYGFIDVKNPELFTHPKVVTPDIFRRPRFALDRKGHYCLNSIFCLTNIDTSCGSDFLLGVLNSKPLAYFALAITPEINGMYHRFSVSHLSGLPIPLAAPRLQLEISELTRLILALNGASSKAQDLIKELDRLVCDALSLSKKQILLIERRVGLQGLDK